MIEKENNNKNTNERDIKKVFNGLESTLLTLKSKNNEDTISKAKIIAEIIGHNLSSDVLNEARRIEPIAPTDAASVGVAKPVRIEPKTDIIKNNGGNKINKILVFSLSSYSLLSTAGIDEGSIIDLKIW